MSGSLKVDSEAKTVCLIFIDSAKSLVVVNIKVSLFSVCKEVAVLFRTSRSVLFRTPEKGLKKVIDFIIGDDVDFSVIKGIIIIGTKEGFGFPITHQNVGHSVAALKVCEKTTVNITIENQKPNLDN